jgi:predicted GTPase
MAYGAGVVAAKKFGASELVDPRPYAVGTIKATFEKYSHMGALLPAMGYGAKQISELERTIAATPCDTVLIATPIDLRRVLKIDKYTTRVRYELQEIGKPTLQDVLAKL